MHVMVAFLVNLSIQRFPAITSEQSRPLFNEKFTRINHTWTEFCDKNIEINCKQTISF